MKAVVCRATTGISGLTLEEVEVPRPGPNDVIIETRACGVHFADGLMTEGHYPVMPSLPFIPGIEVSGVVREVGSAVHDLQPGARVMAYTGIGGYAERVKVVRAQAMAIPEGMDFVTAAAFHVTYGTSYHALKDRGGLQQGETLLVLGAAGGVGLAAVEIGKALGARVIAAASTADKLALCKAYGADDLIDYTNVNWGESINALTNGRGIDVVFDPVGGPQAEAVVRCLRFGGRHLVVGFASGTVPAVPWGILLRKVISVHGVFWGQFADRYPHLNSSNVAELSAIYARGKLRPHVLATYPLTQFAHALRTIMGRGAKGRVILQVGLHEPPHHMF
jgi:NADPH2:quinone reductase